MDQLTRDQIHRFFASHIDSLPHRDQVMARCPLHDDRAASLSINLAKGVWMCHAGCGTGGLIDFEMLVNRCDHETAKKHIHDLLGVSVFGSENQLDAIYQYRDANGIVQFEKVRYPGKKFQNRCYTGKGYKYELGDIRKPLYNLPEVVTSGAVFIVEGEKDADNLRRALESDVDSQRRDRMAVTTNFGGAGKWREEYNPYFSGKKVFIFPDHDAIGRKHAESIAAGIQPYALGTKIVELPGLEDKGDVSDYLLTHTGKDIIEQLSKTPLWRPPVAEQRLFVPAPQFVGSIHDDIDWLVTGLIQRGANGFFVADPKVGKSWAAVDMAIAIATGESWLGFRVPSPARVALISREDSPGLTAWRMKHLWCGRAAARPWLLESNLYVNTRAQSDELMLDDDEQVGELMKAMKTFKPEFAVFDVFNVLHQKDENDNKEMRSVLRRLTRIQSQVGCSIAMVHHFNKGDASSMTKRMRGSSAIHGWAEWAVGISMADPATLTRKMEFEVKAASPPDPIQYKIVSEGETTRLERSDEKYTPPLRAQDLMRPHAA